MVNRSTSVATGPWSLQLRHASRDVDMAHQMLFRLREQGSLAGRVMHLHISAGTHANCRRFFPGPPPMSYTLLTTHWQTRASPCPRTSPCNHSTSRKEWAAHHEQVSSGTGTQPNLVRQAYLTHFRRLLRLVCRHTFTLTFTHLHPHLHLLTFAHVFCLTHGIMSHSSIYKPPLAFLPLVATVLSQF